MPTNAKSPLTGYDQATLRAGPVVTPSRVTVESLRQDLAKLTEIQRDELNRLDRLLSAVNGTIFGPVPAEPRAEPGPLPTALRDPVELLHAQQAKRDELLVDLAKLLLPSGE